MPNSPPWKVHAALTAVSLCFGMHYYWAKVVVGALPQAGWPVSWAAIRICSTAILLGISAMALGRWRLPRTDLKRFAGLALCGIVVNQTCFISGMRHTTPVQAALINLTIPVATLGIGRLLGHETLTLRKVLGILLAMSGVGILLVPRARGQDADWLGNLLMFVNALSFALFLALSRPVMRRTDTLAGTAWLFVFGASGLGLVAAPFLPGVPLREVPARTWAFGIAIVLFATLLPYVLNAWALRRAPASTVAAYIYLQPLVAFGSEALWMQGHLTWALALPAALILGGVALGTSGREASG